MTVTINGTGPIVADASGNVGIGTSSPTQKLDVTGNIKTSSSLYVAGSDSSIVRSGGNPWVMISSNTGYGSAGMHLKLDSTTAGLYVFDNTTSRLTINSSGHVSMPAQPVFYSYRTSNWTTIPGVIICDNAPVNVGGYYSTSTGRFTAPVTGTYLFTLYTLGYVTTNTSNDNYLRKNGTTITGAWLRTWTGSPAGAVSSMSAYISLSVNDYVDFYVANGPALYSDGNAWIRFGGHLIG